MQLVESYKTITDALLQQPPSSFHSSGTSTALGALNLPPELIYQIYDNTDTFRDIISLTITNKLLCGIGYKRIDALILQTVPL